MDLETGPTRISVDSGAQCHYNGCFHDYLSQFDRMLFKKKTLMTQRDSCDVICDVTKSHKCSNKVGRHDSGVWQQYLMRLSTNYIIYVAHFSIPHRLIMGEVTNITDLTSDDLHEKFERNKMRVTWTDLKMKKTHNVWLEWRSVMPKFSSPSQTTGEQSRGTRLEGWHLPQRAEGLHMPGRE